jgi:serine/threonine protein kinase
MARVFKAKDTRLDRPVAVKILHEHLVDDPSFKDRFEREAKLVASLNHPNIVQIYDYSSFERDDVQVYYMVMPYLPGETLRSQIDQCARQGKGLPRDQVVQTLDELCKALAYAHEHGMVHRDVKPGNVILDGAGRAVLSDFGIARMLESTRLTQDSLTTGTPAYMSPEQISGEPGDARSDLYSLGIILYEMLTGRPPYDDEGGLSVVLKHLHAPIPTISDRLAKPEPALDAFFLRALAKEPDERFQTAAALDAAFRQALLGDGGATVIVQATAPKAPAIRLAPTANRTIPLIWLIPVIALVGFGLLLLRTQNDADRIGGSATSAAPEQAVPGIDFNVDAFTTQFELGEPDLALWPGTEPGIMTRTFLPDGIYRLTNEQPGSAHTTLLQVTSPYYNVTLVLSAALYPENPDSSAFGIVFRYQDEDNYNVFAIDGRGRFSIWVRENAMWRELRGVEERWTSSEFVRPLGESNILRINISDENLVGFVNYQPIIRLEESTFAEGRIGIYLAAPDDGTASLDVDSFEVYPIVPAMTDG